MDRRATARRHGGGGGGREDCWSEEATATLIEAWGGRYVQQNRGHLRQTDWREVADAVNARRDGVKPPRTDAQCKNRIDTLKKKYKLEKSKPVRSNWSFFLRLDSLIGAAEKPSAAALTARSAKPRSDSVPIRSLGCESTDSSLDGDRVEVGFDGSVDDSDGASLRELARAILRFGEVYERIETSKQKQTIELEKQRMEFAKDLELQRMNMFMDTQVELQKMKRQKNIAGSGKKV